VVVFNHPHGKKSKQSRIFLSVNNFIIIPGPESFETRCLYWTLRKWQNYKAKALTLHATEALGGEEVQLLLILDLGTRWGWVSASCPGRALAPGKAPPVPTVQETGWAPVPVWTKRLEEKSFRLCRGLILYRPVVQPIAGHYTDWATRLTMTEL
jgi:hypothetical protein